MFTDNVFMSFDVVIKATLILAFAGIIVAMAKKQSAAFRYFVWCSALIGTITVFGFANFAPEWNVAVLPSHSVNTLNDSDKETQALTHPPQARAESLEIPEAEPHNATEASLDGVTDVGSTKGNPFFSSMSGGTWWLTIWMLGFLACIVPVVTGLVRVEFLRKSCEPIEDEAAQRALGNCCRSLGISRHVVLLQLNDQYPPMTSGVFRFAIYLPADWQTWSTQQLQCVLLHELAHIKRRDVGCYLVARFACALYWFHPLAWRGLQLLKIEREVASDDQVISSGQRASEYAQQLVEVAKSCLFQHPVVGTIAMAQTKKLESRIRQILDPTCSHRAPSRQLKTMLVFAIACFAILAGVFNPVSRAVEVTPKETVSKVNLSPSKTNGLRGETKTYQGKVFSPAGQVVANSEVRLIAYTTDQRSRPAWLETRTTADGSFKFELKAESFKPPLDDLPEHKIQFLAMADGYGLNWTDQIASADAPDELSIKLVPDATIQGQLVDLEGNGIADASISFVDVSTSDDEDLSKFVAAIPQATQARPLENEMLGRTIPSLPKCYRTKFKTDSEGRFEFNGFGSQRMVTLRTEGPNIETRIINVMPVEFEGASLPGYIGLAKTFYYGTNFRHPVTPSHPVKGTVLDIDTGVPLAGATIRATRSLGGSRFVFFHEAKSDAEGQFSLTGIPAGTEARLLVMPAEDQPFLDALVKTKVTKDAELLSAKLKRGIWLTGRVVDDKGEPLEAAVFYYASGGNAYRHTAPGVLGDIRGWIVPWYMTKPDGSYRQVGLPGEGLLAVRLPGDYGQRYEMGLGGDKIKWGKNENLGKMILTTSAYIIASNFHRLVPLDLAPEETEIKRDIKLIAKPGS